MGSLLVLVVLLAILISVFYYILGKLGVFSKAEKLSISIKNVLEDKKSNKSEETK